MTDDYTHLIGEIVDVYLAGRVIDAVVVDVETVREPMRWRSQLTIANNGQELTVPPAAIVGPTN